MTTPTTTPEVIEAPWPGFLGLCWGLSITELVAVAGFALFMSWKWRARNRNTEDFVTARRAVPMWRIAWSFFAGTMGAWVISSMSSYAASAGLLGLFMYSFSTGLPILMIAYAGPIVERNKPHAMSLSEFTGWRFGVVAQIGVTLLTILNMSICLLVEYVTIGTMFVVLVGSVAYPIVITVGLLTLTYTALGGLLVSIATDQVQGALALLMMIIVAIYLGVTFDLPLPPMNNVVGGNTEIGLSSIFTMPASMFSCTVFNEGMWQRAFAAVDSRRLHRAGWAAATAAIIVVFISGLCGWLAAWAIPETVFAANVNLYMFYGLKDSINLATGTVNNWMGVLVLLIAVVMNEGAIDSFQNGLLASFSSFGTLGIRAYSYRHPGKLPSDYQLPLWVTRVSVVLINIPLIVLGTIGSSKNWSIMDLFLITNMLVCTASIPMMTGLSSRLYPYYGGGSFLLSWLSGFICPSLYGIFKECWESVLVFDPDTFSWLCVYTPGVDGGGAGMAYTWYRNGYRWQYFLLAIGCSTGAMLVCILVNMLLHKMNCPEFPAIPGLTPLYNEDELTSHDSKEKMSQSSDTSLDDKLFDPIGYVYPEYTGPEYNPGDAVGGGSYAPPVSPYENEHDSPLRYA